MRCEHIGDATLYLADCADVLSDLQRFDAIVTDPPYGIGETNVKNMSREKLAAPKDYGSFDWDNNPADQNLIDLCRSSSRQQIIFGGNYFDLPPTKCWLIWDKQNSGDFADCEMAWTNLDKAVRRIYWRWNGMIRRGDDVREHPTQKPVGVMKWCIEHLKDARTICDPFMGSGTTGVAAVEMGLQFIGVERDERYFDIACRRIEQAYKQPDLLISAGIK